MIRSASTSMIAGISVIVGLGFACAFRLQAEERFRLSESFEPGTVIRVEQKTELSGKVAVSNGSRSELVALVGQGTVAYDERVFASEDPDTATVLRQYRTFEARRQLGSREQSAQLRESVRRMVVLRSSKGKSPFSPDGPLLWSEIDAVRTDPFFPSLVPALLPAKPVAVNDSWSIGPDAISELTDLEKVTDGSYTMKIVGLVTVNGRRQARLSLSGTIRGIDDNGPCKHTLDGTAYFDLTINRLVYLSLKGTHDLLDGSGKTVGTIEGRFTVSRSVIDNAKELSDAAIKDLSLKPTPENSAMLYDNRELGIRFRYSRRWRIGAVQGRQLTLDGPNGGGILITLESTKSLPSAAEFQKESTAFLQKTARNVVVAETIRRVAERPAIDRFALSATTNDEAIRMEYAVLTNADGTGATLAVRLPGSDAKELARDIDLLLKFLDVGKK